MEEDAEDVQRNGTDQGGSTVPSTASSSAASSRAVSLQSPAKSVKENLSPVRTSSPSPLTDSDTWSEGKHSFHRPATSSRSPRDSKHSSIRSSQTYQTRQSAAPSVSIQTPVPVYHLVLERLIDSYVVGHTVKANLLQRDLLSCALVSKSWHGAAREHLYGHIWLLSNAPVKKRRRFSLVKSNTKLELLLNTLQNEPSLAKMIYAAHVGPDLRAELLSPKTLLARRPTALDLLQGFVAACPNLEQISGFVPSLDPRVGGLHRAMLSRPGLKTLALWTDPQNWYMADFERLEQYQACYTSLESLVLQQADPKMPMSSLSGWVSPLIKQLPSLKRLMLSGLPPEDVDDKLLMELPALTALRLDHLPGITNAGLFAFAMSTVKHQLHSLTLTGLTLDDHMVVRMLMEACHGLLRFKLVQDTAIAAVKEDDSSLALLRSASLQYLHWESPTTDRNLMLIAESIRSGALPSLQIVKCPNDDGSVQAVCRPIHDRQAAGEVTDKGRGVEADTLLAARLRAWQRASDHRKKPSVSLYATHEDDQPQHIDTNGTHLGKLDSTIQYSLEPDVPGSGQALSQLTDLTGNLCDASAPNCHVLDYDLLF